MVKLLRTAVCSVVLAFSFTACGGGAGSLTPKSSAAPVATAASSARQTSSLLSTAVDATDSDDGDYLDPIPDFVIGDTGSGSGDSDYLDPIPDFSLCGQSSVAINCTTVTANSGSLPSDTPISGIPGLHPNWLRDAYKIHTASRDGGHGQTIAIIVAGKTPHVASDIAVYRSKFGLGECSIANGCLTRIDSTSAALVYSDAWDVEATIDAEIVSAICPHCSILLVESASTAIPDVAKAMTVAVQHGATILSLSFAGPETGMTAADAAGYTAPDVPFVVGTGDNGAGPTWPASASFAIAVGGTSLHPAKTKARGWTESAWANSGGGCSALVPQPAWQASTSNAASCANRYTADVAAFADPHPGVAIYVTPRASAQGWRTFGGTSVAAPIVAGIIAIAGNPAQLKTARHIYRHSDSLFAVGGNALTSGLGSPNGIGAF